MTLTKKSGVLPPATAVGGAASDISSKSSFVRFNLKEPILSSRFLILVVPTCISNQMRISISISQIKIKAYFLQGRQKYKASSCDFSKLVSLLFYLKLSADLCVAEKNSSSLFNGESEFHF